MAAVLLLGVVSMAVLLSTLSSSNAATQQAIKTQLALKEAKEAVLGYILLDDQDGGTEKPGSLPCPDRNNDNSSNRFDYAFGNCIGSIYTYRFPGENFRTGELRDSANEKLWYAISPEFRAGSTKPLNSLNTGTLSIDDKEGYVAVLIAPGKPLAGQNRNNPAARLAYLESQAAENPFQFLSGSDDETGGSAERFNDRLVGISKKEWEDTLLRRVSAEVIKAINEKKAGPYFPWATPLSGASAPLTFASSPTDPWMGVPNTPRGLLPARKLWPPKPGTQEWPKQQPWQSKNEWHHLFYYVIAPPFMSEGSATCGTPDDCLTLRHGSTQTTNIKALVVYVGPRRNGQIRPSGDLRHYLEGDENFDDDDNVFEVLPAALSNDRFYIIK